MLTVNEIFYSIQGESTFAGLPCIFIRLTGCNLRCSYCDTEYAFYDGVQMSVDEILDSIKKYNCKLVEITGGEPLLYKNSYELMTRMLNSGYSVMLETSGSLPIKQVDSRVKIIIDLKTPSSKMSDKNFYENLDYLKAIDEVKFVIGSLEDFEWAKNTVLKYHIDRKCTVLFSPVFGKIQSKQIVELILENNLNVRFQLQMHKFIWEPDKKGV